jgi:hypothetical protein
VRMRHRTKTLDDRVRIFEVYDVKGKLKREDLRTHSSIVILSGDSTLQILVPTTRSSGDWLTLGHRMREVVI